MLRQYDDYYDRIMSSLDDDLPVEKRLEEIVRGACRFTGDVIGLDLIRVLYTKQISSGDSQSRLLNEDRGAVPYPVRPGSRRTAAGDIPGGV